MNAHRAFSWLLGFSALAGLLMGIALMGPLVAGSFAHQAEMPMSGGLWEVIVACFSQPDMVAWPVLLLVYGPAILLLSALLTVGWTLAEQWLRTRRTISKLHSLAASSPSTPLLSWSPHVLSPQLLLRLRLRGKVDIIDVPQRFAFCHGWLRPRICISTGTLEGLTEHEIEAVLLHERYHMLNYDPLKSALCLVLARVLFLFPVTRALRAHYLVSREIEADRYVLAHQASSKPLLGALYKLIIECPGHAHADAQAQASLAVAGYSDCINQRLDYLLAGRTPPGISSRSLWRTLLVVALIALLGGVGTWNSAANALWHHVYCTVSTCPLMH